MSNLTRAAALPALLIFIGAFVVLVPPSIDVPFATRGEAREALVVKAMIDQQNIVLPLRNGEIIPSKPPLFHWLARAFIEVGGAPVPPAEGAELPIRLPSVLAAGLTLLLLFGWLVPIVGREKAIAAVLVCGTSLEFMRSGSIARVDMVFSACCTGTLVGMFTLVERYITERRIAPVAFVATTVAAGLAFLAKGPAGLALPWIIGALYVMLLLPVRAVPFRAAALSVAGSIFIALCWYVPAYLQGGARFLDVHLMRENVARLVGMDDYETGHSAPFYMTSVLFLAALVPWSLVLPIFARRGALDRLRSPVSLGRPVDARERSEMFALIWCLFFLIFFSFTASKRSAYLLPALPAAAALLGPALLELRTAAVRRARLAIGFVLGIVGFVLSALLALILLAPPAMIERALLGIRKERVRLDTQFALSAIRESEPGSLALFLGGVLVVLAGRALARGEMRPVIGALSLAMILTYAGAGAAVNGPLMRAQSPRPFIEHALRSLPPDRTLLQFKHDFYAATYYSDRNIPVVTRPPEGIDPASTFLLAGAKDLPEIARMGWEVAVLHRSTADDLYGRDRLVLLGPATDADHRAADGVTPR